MTKKEFEMGYIERSNISKKYYDKHFVTLPCNCGEDTCSGFAAVSKDSKAIRKHIKLYT